MSNKIIRYTICDSDNVESLITQVQEQVEEGWELYGTFTIGPALAGSYGEYFYQPMVLRERNE